MDTRRAGEGDLSVMVNEGKTRNKVCDCQSNHLSMCYVSYEAVNHTLYTYVLCNVCDCQ